MQAQLAKWGNSLGVRIPKDIARKAGLTPGLAVEIEAEGRRIVITPNPKQIFALSDLLVGMTPEAMHEAFDWGPDRGRERVE